MTKKKKAARAGRPPLPAAERSALIITVRLLPHDVAQLAELVEDCAKSRADVVRAALTAFAGNKAARARLRAAE